MVTIGQLAEQLQLTPAAAVALPAVVEKFAQSSNTTQSVMLRMCAGCKDLRNYAAELCYEVTNN